MNSNAIDNLLTYLPDKNVIGLILAAACVSVLLGAAVGMIGNKIATHICNCTSGSLVKTFFLMWSLISIVCFAYGEVASGFLSLAVLICLLIIFFVRGS